MLSTHGGDHVIRLTADPRAAGRARAHLNLLTLPLASERRDDLRLLVSELVTNSVRHAHLSPTQAIELSVGSDGARVRVEVRDPGPGFTPPATPHLPPPEQPGGRGLYLLATVADRWGVKTNAITVVWFELDAGAVEGSNGAGPASGSG